MAVSLNQSQSEIQNMMLRKLVQTNKQMQELTKMVFGEEINAQITVDLKGDNSTFEQHLTEEQSKYIREVLKASGYTSKEKHFFGLDHALYSRVEDLNINATFRPELQRKKQDLEEQLSLVNEELASRR